MRFPLTRYVRTLLLMTLAFDMLAEPCAASTEGTWSGWIEAEGRRLEIHGWSMKGESATLHLVPAGLYDLRFSITEQDGTITLRHDTPRAPVILKGSREEDTIRGDWTLGPMGGKFELVRTGKADPSYTKRRVVFESGGAKLAATILTPRGSGPFPAIVWTHGSGSIGRGSSSYVREAFLLAHHGVASILFDKRGVGESEGNWRDATFEQLARDAIAASEVLRESPNVDGDRIGIGGLSQGPSWIVPLALASGGRFAFAISLSASAVTPAEQNAHVIRSRVRTAGFSDDDAEQAEAIAMAEAEFQRTGQGADHVNSLLRAAADKAWFARAGLPEVPVQRLPDVMLSWWHLDPLPLWKDAPEIPVLALFGGRDPLIDFDRSRRLLSEVLGDRLSTHTFANANHELLIETGGIPMLPPDHDDRLIEWVRHVTQPE